MDVILVRAIVLAHMFTFLGPSGLREGKNERKFRPNKFWGVSIQWPPQLLGLLLVLAQQEQ